MGQMTVYFSAASTIVGLLVFLGIVWWAWSARQKKANEESAHIPFDLPDEFKKD
jgi:cytochrome c oxidase cbb3-type subunit 4